MKAARRFFGVKTKKPKYIMFLGAPGVGKGTYASRIAPALDIPTISTGDLVRDEIKQGTSLGAKVKEYSDQGLLVPDDVMFSMVEKRLAQPDVRNGYLFDGFPRTLVQATQLQQLSPLSLVVNLELPETILIDKIMGRRICADCGTGYNITHIEQGDYLMPPLLPKVDGVCDTCGSTKLIQRADDTEQIVKGRLALYKTETMPLVEFYEKEGVLVTFHVKKGLRDLDRLKSCIIDRLQ